MAWAGGDGYDGYEWPSATVLTSFGAAVAIAESARHLVDRELAENLKCSWRYQTTHTVCSGVWHFPTADAAPVILA